MYIRLVLMFRSDFKRSKIAFVMFIFVHLYLVTTIACHPIWFWRVKKYVQEQFLLFRITFEHNSWRWKKTTNSLKYSRFLVGNLLSGYRVVFNREKMTLGWKEVVDCEYFFACKTPFCFPWFFQCQWWWFSLTKVTIMVPTLPPASPLHRSEALLRQLPLQENATARNHLRKLGRVTPCD